MLYNGFFDKLNKRPDILTALKKVFINFKEMESKTYSTFINTFYNKFLEIDRNVMNSDIYKNKIPIYRKNNPEHLYSEYNLINHSKINFVNRLAKFNCFFS